ncbi:MAG TPA: sugar ABC transporter substrate-binding protein [Candidatus Limnocylindrales bacterium]|jgi:ABC-type glycerol-3-phosphate transport system substrate-binding protein
MKMKRLLAIAISAMFALSACNASATPSPAAATTAPSAAAASAPAASGGESAAPTVAASAAPLAVDPAEAVIKNVEPNAEIGFWTFYLSPTFDPYIKETIARFQATYPGVKVNWEDHQATFKDDLNAAFAAGKAPDVINLSVAEGWVSEYASKGLLLPLDDKVPAAVQATYFKGLWQEQLINGKNYQFPWYQGLNLDLINKQLFDKAGLTVADFPKTTDGLPAICKTLTTKAGTVCDIRLTVNDLISQMVYEGGVKPISADGKTFTFDSPEAVKWLTMYRDMVVTDKSVDTDILTTSNDRVGLLLFSSGQAPFYATGPNLIRDVKANNSQLYGNLGVVPIPVGASGVVGKGLMSISVKADTKFPNASMALAQFFSNARSMTAFAKIVSVYPSTIASYDDPFFSSSTTAIEDSARATAKDVVSKYADIVPTIPKKADVNDIVLKAIESALFNKVDPQKALTDAVTAANALIK